MSNEMFYAFHQAYSFVGVGESAEEAISSLESLTCYELRKHGPEGLWVIEGTRKRVAVSTVVVVAGDYND